MNRLEIQRQLKVKGIVDQKMRLHHLVILLCNFMPFFSPFLSIKVSITNQCYIVQISGWKKKYWFGWLKRDEQKYLFFIPWNIHCCSKFLFLKKYHMLTKALFIWSKIQ